jgi:hypothetical protein
MGLFGAQGDDQANDGCIEAKEILKDLSKIQEIPGRYTIIYDSSQIGLAFDNLVRAINIMANSGWRCVNISSMKSVLGSNAAYALMVRE